MSLDSFSTFGDLLKYLRRAGLTQREISIAVKSILTPKNISSLTERGRGMKDDEAVAFALGLDEEAASNSRQF